MPPGRMYPVEFEAEVDMMPDFCNSPNDSDVQRFLKRYDPFSTEFTKKKKPTARQYEQAV